LQSRYRVLLICSVLHAMNHSYWNLIPPVIPLIMQEFGFGYSVAGLVISSFYLTYAIFQLPVGIFSDRIARRLLLAPGVALSALGMGLTTLATNLWQLVTLQGVSGIGGSTYHPTGLSLIGDTFPPQERGRAIGIHGAAASVGFFVTPVILASLTGYGWRTPLLIVSLPGYLLALLVWFYSPAEIRRPTIRVRSDRRPVMEGVNRHVVFTLIIRSLFGIADRGIHSFLPAFLHAAYGFEVGFASLLFSISPGAGLISGPLGGMASDRFGRKKVIFLLMAAISLSAVGLGFQTTIPVLVVLLMVFGGTANAFVPVTDALTADLLPQGARGSGFGVLYTVVILAQAVAPAIAGFLVDFLGFQSGFLILGVTAAFGFPFAALTRSRQP